MDRKQIERVLGSTASLVLWGLAVGCGPFPTSKQRPIDNVLPSEFQCARALVDQAHMPLSAVILTGEPTIDAFLYETAELQVFSVAIERALVSLNNPEVQKSMGVDAYTCAGKEIQQAILGLSHTGQSLVQRGVAATSFVDDYCKASPLSCLSVGKRLSEATNSLQSSIQSLSRSSAEAGRLLSETISQR